MLKGELHVEDVAEPFGQLDQGQAECVEEGQRRERDGIVEVAHCLVGALYEDAEEGGAGEDVGEDHGIHHVDEVQRHCLISPVQIDELLEVA